MFAANDSGNFRRKVRRAISLVRGEWPRNGPNFFIVGATRSGSSFLHDLLRQHPDVYVTATKELTYFNSDATYTPSLRGYRLKFLEYKGQHAVGESTPMYMEAHTIYGSNGRSKVHQQGDAIERISRHFPHARLILTLRDPATRILSIYEKNMGQGKLGRGASRTALEEDLLAELSGAGDRYHLIYRNNYERHLRNIFDHFPREQVLILVFEEWKRNLQHAINCVHSFIGVEPRPVDEALSWGKNERGRYINSDPESLKVLSAVSDEVMDRVIAELQPSRAYLEALLGRQLPWRLPGRAP
jgi:hypothetical protein